MTMTVAAGPGVRAGWREWTGLAVLALPTLLVSLDIFVMLLALPHVSADLGASSRSSCGSWTSTGSWSPAS